MKQLQGVLGIGGIMPVDPKAMFSRVFLERGLGKYELLELIKSGSMSDLHKARNKHTGDIVCLKLYNRDGQVMRSAIEQKHARIRKTLLSIQHPYVVKTYEFGATKGRMYSVTQFVPGTAIGYIMRGQAGTFLWWLKIFKQIIGGMRYLHEEAKLVHRDLNPFNVMLTPAQRIKIVDLDFSYPINTKAIGLFRRSGTLGYMAPEQAVGDVLDARVDVYAFGASVYEVLTKGNPFRDKSSPDLKIREERTRLAHLRHTPPPPSTINSDVPVEFDRIIMKCLEPKRVSRYDDFAQVQESIERVEGKLGIEAGVRTSRGPAVADDLG